MTQPAGKIVLVAALLLAASTARAQVVDESKSSVPSRISVSARLPEPIAVKCRNHLRQGCRPATRVAEGRVPPPFEVEPEPAPTETLAQALASAYETAPTLQAQRYQLRASDEDYAQALSELRPTSELQVTGTYDKTVPGRVTQATRFGAKSPIETSNTMAAQAIVTQPLYTGGKAAADREAALAEVRAGREQLRGAEGDLLLQVIAAYADIRRDSQALRLYSANLRQLQATLDEVKARREAGELTRTDIAQAETQFDLARSQTNTTRQQLEQDRAAFAALVGHDAGVLAPPPSLPHVPGSVDEALDFATQQSPDLAQAIATERQSRARIAAAASQGRPTLTITGTATLTGQAVPFYLYNEDQQFRGQAVLTIPLTNGGRVGSLVAQAEDRNAADRIGIETARRQMVDTIVNAWNGIATTERNIEVDTHQVSSAKVFDEGTFEEYRAGLRSTFDVLYAHSALLNAQVALVAARHDLYIAEATLLRRIGMLEARSLLTGTGLYNPDTNLRHAAARGALPWDTAVRALDRIDRTRLHQRGIQQPPLGNDTPAIASAPAGLPAAEPATVSAATPVPGTVGIPIPDRSLKHP
jgi:outer membrane protein